MQPARPAPATPGEVARHRHAQWRGQFVFALAVLTLLGFAAVMALVVLGDTVALDRRVTLGMQWIDSRPVFALLLAVSWPGFQPQATVLALSIVSGLYWRRLRLEAGFAVLAVILGMVHQGVKLLTRRPRPIATLGDIRVYGQISGTSFPSGHVLTYVVFGGFLFYLTYTLLTRSGWRSGLLTLLAGLIVLIGPSRIYLGHHWFTDVLASYLLGVTLLVVVLTGYRRAKARQLRRLTPVAAP